MRYLVRYAVGLGVDFSCRGTVWYSLLLEWSRLEENVDILAVVEAVATVMALHVAKTPHDTMVLLYIL